MTTPTPIARRRTIRIECQRVGDRPGDISTLDVVADILDKHAKAPGLPYTAVFVETDTDGQIHYEPMLVVTDSIREVAA